jgi:histidinol-phosphate aminotransferase
MAPYHGPDDPEYLARRLGRPVEAIIKLDANENPYGASPLVQEALSTFSAYSVYPDASQRTARAAVAKYAGVSDDLVMLTNGGDASSTSHATTLSTSTSIRPSRSSRHAPS